MNRLSHAAVSLLALLILGVASVPAAAGPIVVNAANSAGCGGVATSRSFAVPGGVCPGCVGGAYAPTASGAIPASNDFLRLLFFGIHHDTGNTRDCNSPARTELAKQYTNLFQTGCGGGACAGKPLSHLWRPRESEAATFAALLGTDVKKFCNAGNAAPPVAAGSTDFLDKDPIRVACVGNGSNAGEQVCGSAVAADSYDPTKNTPGYDGEFIAANAGRKASPTQAALPATLGLVTVVYVPGNQAAPDPVTGKVKDILTSQLYATTTCDSESMLLEASKPTFFGTCASGGPSFGGLCFTSVIRTAPLDQPIENGFNATCFQRNSATACPFLTPEGVDCRGANLWLRKSDGTIVQDTSLTAAGRKYTGAFYRIHQTKSILAASAPCAEATSAAQTNCLVTNGDGCSAGANATPSAAQITLDPAGYTGSICIVGMGCVAGGAAKSFSVPPGTYQLSESDPLGQLNASSTFVQSTSASDPSLGTLVVDAQGTATTPAAISSWLQTSRHSSSPKPRRFSCCGEALPDGFFSAEASSSHQLEFSRS